MTLPPDTSLASTIVTDEQAKAVSSLGTFGATAVTEAGNLARWIGRIIGTVPEDAIGLVIGDPLHAVRTLTAGWYDSKVTEILERREAKVQPVSLSVALPLIRGAYDESREGLRDMWAALIAAAMDPDRAGRVRLSFIETLKQFDPLDAITLRELHLVDNAPNRKAVGLIKDRLSVSEDDAIVSIQNLKRLECLWSGSGSVADVQLTPYGRSLLRAASD